MATVRLVERRTSGEQAGGAPVVEDVTETRRPPAPAAAPGPDGGAPWTAPSQGQRVFAAPQTRLFGGLGAGVALGVLAAAALVFTGAYTIFTNDGSGAIDFHDALGFTTTSVLILALGLVVLLVSLARALRSVAAEAARAGSDAHIHASVRRTPLPGQVGALAAEDQRLRGLVEQQRAAVRKQGHELQGQREELAHLAARQDEAYAARIQQEFRALAGRVEGRSEEVASRAEQRADAVTREAGQKLEAMLADARTRSAAIQTEQHDLERLRAGLSKDREALGSQYRAHEAQVQGAWQRFLAEQNAATRRNTEAWQGEMRARIAELEGAIQELREERAAIQAERAAWAGELRQRVEATVPEVVPPVVRQSVGRALTEAFSSRRFYLMLGGSLLVGMAIIVGAALLGVRNLGLLTPETAFMTGGLAVGLVAIVLLVLLGSLGGALRKLVRMAG